MHIEMYYDNKYNEHTASVVEKGDSSGVYFGKTDLSVDDVTPTSLSILCSTGTEAILPIATASLAGLMSSAAMTKLDNLSANATQNSADSYLLNRANHTSTQLASTISDFTSAARTASVGNSIGSGVSNIAPSQGAVFTALFDKVDKVSGKGLSSEDYTSTEKVKLSGISSGATVNNSDSYLLSRANHTGSQPSSTISDFNSSVDGRIISGITGKENTITVGTTVQYWRGDKTWQNFPSIPSIIGLRKAETFLGTTDSSGNYVITFANTYATAPDVQPQIIGGNFNQFVRILSVSTTGATIQCAQRNTVNLLATELLLGTTVVLNGANVSVLVTPRA